MSIESELAKRDRLLADKSARIRELEEQLEERTCKNVGERCDFACSECGARLYTEMSDGYTMILGDEETILLKPNYCPNCGARVTPKNSETTPKAVVE